MEEPIKNCKNCGEKEKELLKCSRCKKVYYCGADCQRKNWPSHKLTCSKPQQTPILPPPPKEEGIAEFEKMEHIGSGNFSTIFRGVSKKDGKVYAIKQAEKAQLQRVRKQADLFMEKHCLNRLKDCNYVVRLHRTFQDPLHLFMQMECPSEGELWEQSKFFGVPGESLFKYYVCHLFKAISIIHDEYQIVHRDLKPQNILLAEEHQLKLIDFGTAKDLSRPDIKGAGNGLKGRKPFQHYVGTPNYMAPQCIHNKASEKISDVYSLSGILYHLKVGSAPFAGGSQYMIFKKSLETELLLCPELFSKPLADLIHKMNAKDMDGRLPLKQAMEHEYFEGIDWANLPSYTDSLDQLTPLEKYISKKCKQLIATYQGKHKESQEAKEKLYNEEIAAFIERFIKDGEEGWCKQLEERAEIIKIQIKLMLNSKQDSNIGFSELYRQLHHISDPVLLPVQEPSSQQKVELKERQEVCTSD